MCDTNTIAWVDRFAEEIQDNNERFNKETLEIRKEKWKIVK